MTTMMTTMMMMMTTKMTTTMMRSTGVVGLEHGGIEQVVACNGVLHMVDTVLLPFDGDGELDDEQKRRLADAKRALDAKYPDRPADIDPEYEAEDVFEYSAATIPDDRVD